MTKKYMTVYSLNKEEEKIRNICEKYNISRSEAIRICINLAYLLIIIFEYLKKNEPGS